MKQRVVLVGAGHAHLHVAAHAARFTRRGIEVVLIDPGSFWYSGLATGVLAGQYDARTDQVDPARLVHDGGGRLVRDRLTRVDSRQRAVILASGDTIEYDVLSLNIGSVVNTRDLPGADEHAWTVKPISNLWSLRQHLEKRFRTSPERPVDVIVVGGGATGCEVAACIDSLAFLRDARVRVSLLSRSNHRFSGLPPGASRALSRVLKRRGVEVVSSWEVQQVEEGAVVGSDGRRLQGDVVVAATGLAGPPLLERLELPLDRDGALRVRSTLQSVGDDRIFAVGDCAGLEGYRLPKLGVFGVRQAPVLLHNLAAFPGGRRLKEYRPQKRCLMILNLGRGRALAVYGRLHWLGRPSYWIKDLIDRRFLARYR